MWNLQDVLENVKSSTWPTPPPPLRELYAWGNNNRGQLGINAFNPPLEGSSPVQVGALTSWIGAEAGNTRNAVGLLRDGTVWSWGENNNGCSGQNEPELVDRSSPTQIGTETFWAEISMRGTTCIAQTTSGNLYGWGKNTLGDIGDGSAVNRSSPVQIGALTNWAQFSAGINQTHAIKNDGTLWAWGNSFNGELGDGTTVNKSSPVQIGSDTDWAFVSSGQGNVAAIKTDGTLYVWGTASNGELGDNQSATNRSSPVQLGSDTDWAFVYFGGFADRHAIKTDGSLYSWGLNNTGASGLGDIIARSSPVQVGALTNWSELSGHTARLAVKTDGTMWSWGFNGDGQQGQNDQVRRSSPVQVGSEVYWKRPRMHETAFAVVSDKNT